MNSSCERRRATTLNQRVMTLADEQQQRQRDDDLDGRRCRARMRGLRESPLPSAGIMISSGTTARSWNSSTPMMLRPCSVSSSSRSASILLRSPSTTSPARRRARRSPASAYASRSSRSSRSTQRDRDRHRDLQQRRGRTPCRRIERSLASENSSPIENIRNTTPNSARCCAPSLSGTSQRMRPDDDADHQVAEHRRQVQKPEHDDARHRASSSSRRHFERRNHPY